MPDAGAAKDETANERITAILEKYMVEYYYRESSKNKNENKSLDSMYVSVNAG